MSVLFRGMEYPKTCSDCLMHDVDDDYCRALGEYVSKGKPMWCPAEEVNVPHGRLIDADVFAENIKTTIERQGYDDLTIDKFLTVGEVLNAVIADLKGMTLYDHENAPTVIEAEGTKNE